MQIKMTMRISLLWVLLVVLCVYYPVVFLPLNSVDDVNLHHYLLNIDNFGFREIFSPVGSVHYYRPVYWLSYWADKHVWGLEESFMHLENMVIHLLNVMLLFAITRRACLLKDLNPIWFPLVAALIFALHPLNTEAVNWIVGRTDMLAALFLLLSTWLLLRDNCRLGLVLLAAISMFVACLAKETAVFYLPAAMLLPFFLPARSLNTPLFHRSSLRHWPHLVFFPVSALAYFLFRHFMSARGDAGVSHVVSRLTGGHGFGWLESARLMLKATGFYLKKLFIPFPLNFGIIHVSDLYIPVGGLVVLLVCFWLNKRSLTTYFFFSAAAVGSSALLVPLMEATWTPLAERYMYIPTAFFVVGLVLLGAQWVERLPRPKLLFLPVCMILIIFASGTVNRIQMWKSNQDLFQDTLTKSPYFTPAKIHLALAMGQQGPDSDVKDVTATLDELEPLNSSPLVLMNQSDALFQRGEDDAAHRLLKKALENPGPNERLLLGRLLSQYDQLIMRLESGQELIYPETVPLLIRLYELSDNPFYLYRLGQAYLFLHDKKSAQESFALAAAQATPTAHYYSAAIKLSKTLAE